MTIGELERRAGITDRTAFWLAIGKESRNRGWSARDEIDRGVSLLRALIRDREKS